eukprot:SAG25_NODE_384_length_8785_cov_7.011628_14_plen_118_part_00
MQSRVLHKCAALLANVLALRVELAHFVPHDGAAQSRAAGWEKQLSALLQPPPPPPPSPPPPPPAATGGFNPAQTDSVRAVPRLQDVWDSTCAMGRRRLDGPAPPSRPQHRRAGPNTS